jgi:sigma-B regulation protein RsbU (phosphoserine phosphatase)
LKDLGDLRQRFDAFAARFSEHPGGRPGAGAGAALSDDYWENVQALFTRDVTAKEFHDLVGYDTPDAWRYFSREIDFAALQAKPWYYRYPVTAWKVFLAMAFRLSPARRVLFAVSVPLLAIAWLRYALAIVGPGAFEVNAAFTMMLFATTLMFALLVMELRDKLALKGDLEIARQIQFGLLPFAPLEIEGTAIHSVMRPANTVGGDYFDVIELGEGRLAVVVGDVAGKGIPAALLMALLQGSLRTLITAGLRGADLVTKLNTHLHVHIPRNRLVTLFYAEYEPATGRLEYVNAGHNAPYLLHRDGVERLSPGGMALGVVDQTAYEGSLATIEPGERLFLFTDGVTEAFDAQEQEYGEERLEAFLLGHPRLPHRDLIEAVREDVLAFCGPVRPRDDMTLMVVGR